MAIPRKEPYQLVRIKELNKGLGQLARRYTHQGKRFDIDHKGWYKVGRSMANEIAEIRHPSSGALIFDVYELDRATEISENEAHESWATGHPPPSKAPEVKVREFSRRKEIKDEREANQEGSADGWDDSSVTPVTRATQPADDDDVPSTKASKKAGGKKKSVKRRSATK